MSQPAPDPVADGFLAFCGEVGQWDETGETLDERTRARVLVKLATYRTAYETYDHWLPLCSAVCRLCSVKPERLSQLLVIKAPREMRVALRSDGAVLEPRPRAPDESAYPTSGWISDYMDLHSHVEAPYAFHFWCAVAVAAACARRNFFIEWGAYPVYAHHYIMLVQESGSGKSIAIEQAKHIVDLVNEELKGSHGSAVAFPGVNLHAGGGTPEGFADMICIQPGIVESTGMIICDELIAMFGRNQTAGDRWVTFLTDLYTKNSFADPFATRKKRHFKDVAVTTLFGTTQDWLRKEFSGSSLAGGWVARLLHIERPESDLVYPKPPPIDPIALRKLAQEIAQLCLAHDEELLLTPDAEAWYEKWYREDYKPQGRVMDRVMRTWHNRLRTHVLKLALVLAMCERPRAARITLEHIQQAIASLAVEAKRLPEAFAALTAPEQVDQLERLMVILRAHGRVSWSRLMNNAKRIGNTKVLRELIEAGVETGQLHLDRDPKDCRVVQVCVGAKPQNVPHCDPPLLPAQRRRD